MSTGGRVLRFADACRIYYIWSTHSAELDQPGMVANPARGQLNRKHICSLSPFAPKILVSRDGFGRPIRVSPLTLILHTWAKSSRFPRRRPHVPSTAIGSRSVRNLSGHVIAYRLRSLLRVRRHRASSPQGSSSNG